MVGALAVAILGYSLITDDGADLGGLALLPEIFGTAALFFPGKKKILARQLPNSHITE